MIHNSWKDKGISEEDLHYFGGDDGHWIRCRVAMRIVAWRVTHVPNVDMCVSHVHGQAPGLYPLVVMEEMMGFPCLGSSNGTTESSDLRL